MTDKGDTILSTNRDLEENEKKGAKEEK